MSKSKQIQHPQTLLCIDVSYLLFYRINALRTWHKHRTKEDATDDIMLSETFKDKLLERIDFTIKQLFKTHQPHAILCGYDGHNNWRKQEYNDYKKGRVHHSATLKLFQYGQSYILNQSMNVPCQIIHQQHDALEADDFIHFATRKLCAEKENVRVVIIANDHDYLPLLGSCNVHVFSLKSKNNELKLPLNSTKDHPLTGEQYLLYKIIMGDKSDNIMPVFKGYGKVRSLRLVCDTNALDNLLTTADKETLHRYKTNRRLIDNRCLPDALKVWMEEHWMIKM